MSIGLRCRAVFGAVNANTTSKRVTRVSVCVVGENVGARRVRQQTVDDDKSSDDEETMQGKTGQYQREGQVECC